MPLLLMKVQSTKPCHASRHPASFLLALTLAGTVMLLASGCWPVPDTTGGTQSITPTGNLPGTPPSRESAGALTPLPSVPGVLNIAFEPDDPASLDPATASDDFSRFLIRQIYSGLLTFDDNLNVVPDVAASMPSISADGKTYTFTLKRGVRFPDGQEVTAADFKYSFERAADPRLAGSQPPAALPAGVYFDDIVGLNEKLTGKSTDISGVQAPDPYTLVLTIDSPKSYFLAKLAAGPDFVVERSSTETGADWSEHPKGTGPYTLEKWIHRYQIVLAGRDGYYGGKPAINQVNVWMGANARNGRAQYEAGGLDVTSVSTADLEHVSDRNNPLSSQLQSSGEPGVTYLGFNLHQKPFDDPKIRQALSEALDRQQIAHTLFQARVQPAVSFVPPGIAGYSPPDLEDPYDVTQARELIAESTYKSSQNLPKLSIYSSGDALGAVLKDMFSRSLGLQVDTYDLDQNDYLDGLSKGAFPMFTLTLDASYPEPAAILDNLFRSGSDGNFTGYKNPDVDTALDAAASETDPGKHLSIYAQVEDRILRDYPAVPLYHYLRYMLVKPYVHGLRLTPLGILSLLNVTIAEH